MRADIYSHKRSRSNTGPFISGFHPETVRIDVPKKQIHMPPSEEREHKGKQKYILKALSEKTESSFDASLVEGKEGHFFMTPVHKGDAYLGMVYLIRIKP